MGALSNPRTFFFALFCCFFVWQIFTWVAAPAGSPRVAIVVLGGGLLSNGEVPPHTKLRLAKASELYFSLSKSSGAAVDIITLSGATPHKPPPLDKQGFPIGEAQAAAAYLIKQSGIPPASVAEENFSLDTLGNAYWLRTVHIEPGGYTKLVVLTNDWHMPRTRAIFSHVFGLPRRAGGHSALKRKFELSFVAVDAGLAPDFLQARVAREAASLETFVQRTKALFGSMRELHDYVFEKHGAYASSRLLQERQVLSHSVLASY